MATIPAEENDPLKPRTKVSRAGWYALALVSAAQAMSLLDRQILAILAPSISRDLGIGDAEIGLLYGTLFALFYALFSLPLGRLVDGWIRTKLLGICLAFWSISTGLAAFANGFLLLAVSRLGVGIGEGATQPAANSIIFDEFPREKRGTAMAALGIAVAIIHASHRQTQALQPPPPRTHSALPNRGRALRELAGAGLRGSI